MNFSLCGQLFILCLKEHNFGIKLPHVGAGSRIEYCKTTLNNNNNQAEYVGIPYITNLSEES